MTLGVFLDRGSVDRGDLNWSEIEETLPDWRFYDATPENAVAERVADAAVVVTNKVPVTARTLQTARRLRLVCIAATGTNNVDLEAARHLDIPVCNVRGYSTPAVVQHVFALLLALTTRLPEYRQAVTAGRWQRSDQFCLMDYPIREIAGKTLGIIGYGTLGREVENIARAFGMRVLIAQRPGGAPRAGRLALHELLPQVDVLSLHCPLTPETRGLIGARELALMKPDAVLINTARGGLMDEAALAEALREGRLGGAGVDVLTQEPPRQGNPLLAPDIPHLIVTPHVAWSSREARQRLLHEVTRNIRAFLADEPRNLVN